MKGKRKEEHAYKKVFKEYSNIKNLKIIVIPLSKDNHCYHSYTFHILFSAFIMCVAYKTFKNLKLLYFSKRKPVSLKHTKSTLWSSCLMSELAIWMAFSILT